LDIGYVYIGMDHFAKPDDELAVAQRDGVLQRNFRVIPPMVAVIWLPLGFHPLALSTMCLLRIASK